MSAYPERSTDIAILLIGLVLFILGLVWLLYPFSQPFVPVARFFGTSWTIAGAILSWLGVVYLFRGLRRTK